MDFLLVCYLLALFELSFSTPLSGLREERGIKVPLRQHLSQTNVAARARHVARKYGNGLATKRLAMEPQSEDGGFWYGAFTVGEAKNLSLLIDTGSQDVAVNPSLYMPTQASQALHRNGTLFYETAQANGCGVANISYRVYKDTVCMAGLESQNQAFANVVATRPPNKGVITKFPHQGLVGFSGTRPNETQLHEMPFFKNLCIQGRVNECRFGMALGTDGLGQQILGGVNEDLFSDPLSTTALYDDYEWAAQGNVALNGNVVLKDQVMILDSGTENIIGPIAQVRSIFQQLGIQAVEQHVPGCTSVLVGYYPCDSPPSVGFQFGSTNPVFDIPRSAFNQAGTGGNCTSIVTGIDFHFRGHPLWVLGQAWFQGKYVDHDVTGGSIGVAWLKDGSTGGARK